MSFLQLSGLQKQFGNNPVVKDFSLSIAKGAFVSLLGPSGCGKTTVLRMVGGFEQPDQGAIKVGDKTITDLKANQRNIGMVFQSYALFPNMTVADNIGFGLKVKGASSSNIRTTVKDMLSLIGLPDKADRYPYQLSGGQQQRVALARALAPKPEVLLLDEPLSALDAKIRVSLRNEIRAIQRRLGITTIFVTHDQDEALSMSDQVVVMNGGIAEQADTPHMIYNKPKTAFVANFVGSLNMFEAGIVNRQKCLLSLAGKSFVMKGDAALPEDGNMKLGLRPEALHLAPAPKSSVEMTVEVVDLVFMGSVARAELLFEGKPLTMDLFSSKASAALVPGQKLKVWFDPSDLFTLGH
jgi:putative spermidine/putrescine transport system ATP-binding protein